MTTNRTIEQTHELLVSKKISCVDLVSEYFAVIEQKDSALHAFLSLRKTEALDEAKVVDEKIARGEEIGMFEGIPISLKDNIAYAGTITTAGSKMLEQYSATYDAFVVQKMKEAGMIILGKTNMDEFAMGGSTENSAFGPTKNPHNTEHVTGGTSGGAAASVSAGEVVAAIGSDTGGSIRQPSAFCGVVGLKPTYGSVSRSGLIAMTSSYDQIGPITNSVRDAELLFGLLRGKDKKDATSVTYPESFVKTLDTFTVGIPKEYFAKGLDTETKQVIDAAIEKIKALGATVKEISLPHTEYALATYYIIMFAEASSNLARFDGVRYGLQEKGKDLLETYQRSRTEGFGPEVRRRIILGTHVLSSGYYDAFYGRAQKTRRLIREDFEKAFDEVDIILTPTTPTPAFKIGEKSQDPLEMYLADIFTVSVNLAGVPAISIPCGKVGELPVGMQLIAPMFQEQRLFDLGKQYEDVRGAI